MTRGGLRSPYPGLRAFHRDESHLFFGRDSCVTDMVSRLARSRFLAVLGSSGTGKSSLMRTGLLDALELGLHPAGSDWLVVDMHPAGAPFRALAEALLATDGGAADEIAIDLLTVAMQQGPRALVEWAQAGRLDGGRQLLLLVDQFEELFRYSDFAGLEEAAAFARLMIESSQSDQAAISICLTMRTEFLGTCGTISGLVEQINQGLYLTPRMTRNNCREAIEGPAIVAGFAIEPALTNQVLNDLAMLAPWHDGQTFARDAERQSDQLPLMQHVLNRMWLKANETGNDGPILLTREAYATLGGLTGAIDSHGDEILAGLGVDRTFTGECDLMLKSIAAVFRGLVSGRSLAAAVRYPRSLDDIERLVGDKSTARRIVDAFRGEGDDFLRPGAPALLNGNSIIDISHESLIRQWSRLKAWFETEREAGSTWRQLVRLQEAYAARRGELLGGLTLATYRQWLHDNTPNAAWVERYGGDLPAVEAFVQASIEEDEQRIVARTANAERQLRQKSFKPVRLAFALIAALVIATSSWRIPLLNDSEAALYDLRASNLAPGVDTDKRIALVVYTKDTLRATQQVTPVDRTILAKALAQIDKFQPKAVGIDILFDSPQDDDALLQGTLKGMMTPVFLAFVDAKTNPDAITYEQEQDLRAYVAAAANPQVKPASILLETDSDNVARRWPRQNAGSPPLLAVALSQAGGNPDGRFTSYTGPIQFRLPRSADTPVFDKIPIDLLADPESAPLVQDVIKNRYVIIGGDFADFDQFDTPFTRTGNPITGERRTTGVELHATMLAQLLDGKAPQRLPSWVLWLLPFLVIGGASATALFGSKNLWIRLSAVLQPLAILPIAFLLESRGVVTLGVPSMGWFFAWLIAYFAVPVMPKVVVLRT